MLRCHNTVYYLRQSMIAIDNFTEAAAAGEFDARGILPRVVSFPACARRRGRHDYFAAAAASLNVATRRRHNMLLGGMLLPCRKMA